MIGYEKPKFGIEADGVLKNSYTQRKTKKPTNSVIAMTPLKGTHDSIKR